MAPLSDLGLQLLAFVLETLLYGIFIVLGLVSLYLLVKREWHRHPERHRLAALKSPSILSTIWVVSVVTAHWIVGVVRIFEAFIFFEGGFMPLLYLANPANKTDISRNILIFGSVLTCDLMMIYRLWMVWQKNRYIVIPPLISWVALFVSAGFSISYLPQWRALEGELLFDSKVGKWVWCDAAFTFFTTCYCSALIAWKIWSVSSTALGSRGGLNNVVTIVIESAAFWVSFIIAYIVIFAIENPAHNVMLQLANANAGIAFVLINVRVGLGIVFKPENHTTSSRSHNRWGSSSFTFRNNLRNTNKTVSTTDLEMDLRASLRHDPQPTGKLQV